MDLEDFKSFSRVLKPSGVGSIPTHSRQIRSGAFPRVALVLFLLAALGGSARAAEGPPQASPFWSSSRSLVFPGWGQLHNGSEKKAIVLFSLQTYLIGRVFAAERRARYYQDRMNDETPGWSREDLQARYDDLRDTRGDLVWWSSLLVLYSVIDAYVDAHLVGFEEQVEQVERVTASLVPTDGGAEAAIAFRF